MSGIRLCGKLKELRIHLCQKSPGSEGVRQFIQKEYVNLKKNNPGFPILIRECKGVEARVWARYDKGVETSATLEKLSASDVTNTIKRVSQ